MQDLIDRYVVLTEEKKDVQDLLAEVVNEYEKAEMALITSLHESGLVEATTTSGHTLCLNPQTCADSVSGVDDLIAALKTHPDAAWLVRETVHMETLSAWVREKLSAGGLPESLRPHIRLNEVTHLGMKEEDRDRG
jgi:hypothetical protein